MQGFIGGIGRDESKTLCEKWASCPNFMFLARIKGYRSTYLPGGPLAEKLIVHTHNQVMHLGAANTMASVRESWWIPKLRGKVKKVIKKCNVCSGLYQTVRSAVDKRLARIQNGGSRPFEVTGVDFAGPFRYNVGKKEGKRCYYFHLCQLQSGPFRSRKNPTNVLTCQIILQLLTFLTFSTQSAVVHILNHEHTEWSACDSIDS